MKAKWVGERREGEELSFIPLFTEYNTGQERSKKEPWFCDMSANPVTSGALPGMLQNALRFFQICQSDLIPQLTISIPRIHTMHY